MKNINDYIALSIILPITTMEPIEINNNRRVLAITALVGITVFVLVAFSTVLIMGTVYGFSLQDLFGNNKPAKPEFMINPQLQSELDKLYEKYPNISQQDVNDVHTSVSTECFIGAKNSIEDEKSRNNIFGQTVGMAFCQGFATGIMNNYLDALGVKYYESSDSAIPPQLLSK